MSNPTSLGVLTLFSLPLFGGQGTLYFNSLKSKAITASVDGTQPTPITIEVTFDCSTKNEIEGTISVDFLSFSLSLKLTLTKDGSDEKIDALSWVTDLNGLVITPSVSEVDVSGSFLGQPVSAQFAFDNWENQFDAFKDGLLAKVIVINLVTSRARDPHDDIVSTIREPDFQQADHSGCF